MTEQIEVAQVVGANRALARVGQDYARAVKDAEVWQLRAQEAQAKLDSMMKVLEEKGVDLAALLAPEGEEPADVAPGATGDASGDGDAGPLGDGSAVAETEEDDGTAAS